MGMLYDDANTITPMMLREITDKIDSFGKMLYDYDGKGIRANTITVNKLQSDVGRDLDISSNQTIILHGQKIGLIVKDDNTINPAGIVLAINEGASNILISADHVDLKGKVTISDFDTSLSTEFNEKLALENFQNAADAAYKQVVTISKGTITASYINSLNGISLGYGASINWTYVNAPTAAQVGALDSSYSNRLTKITSNGIYTGTIDAGQITSGKIYTDYLQPYQDSVLNFSSGASLDCRNGAVRLRYDSWNYIYIGDGRIDFYIDGSARATVDSTGIH